MLRSGDRSVWLWVRNAVLVTAGLAGLGAGAEYLREFARLDPFAAYKQTSDSDRMNPAFGILLKDVELKHYKGKELTTRAKVGEMGIRTDRKMFDLKAVKDGVYQAKEGPVKFEAATGEWNAYTGILTVTDSARVATKDLDMSTSMVVLDHKKGTLNMPKPLRGKLLKGEVEAGSLLLHLNDDRDLVAKNVTWAGNMAPVMQDDENAPRKWTILKMDKVESQGDVVVYTNGEITDGDVIVHANRIEHERKKDVVTATGKVDYYSGAADATADKAVIYRKEKRAVLTGKVTMLVRPKDRRDEKPKQQEIKPFEPVVPDSVKAGRPTAKPEDKQKEDDLRDPKTIRTYPMAIRAETIEYWYGKGSRRAKIDGAPQARQELPENRWRHVWSTTASWDGEKDLLTLMSAADKVDVRMKNSMGDDLKAKTVVLSTLEDDDTFTAEQPTGDIYSTDDEEIPRIGNSKADDKKVTPPSTGP